MKYIKLLFGFLFMLSILWIGKLLFNHLDNKVSLKSTKDINESWESFSTEKINNYIEKGYPVFVDVTADWCITCQFNKKNVLERKQVIRYMNEKEIKKIRADWTLPDEKIIDYLKSFNKYGIPFNVIYSKKHPDGFTFKEVLNLKEFMIILEEAITNSN